MLNPGSSVSICLSSSSGFKWTSVCSSGWTITHAKLACKQNGMDFQGTYNKCSNNYNYNYIIISMNIIIGAQVMEVAVVDNDDLTSCVTFPDCNGYEQNLTECIREHSFDLLSTTSLAGFMCGKKLQSIMMSSSLYSYMRQDVYRLIQW